jgi:hypothetical protein
MTELYMVMIDWSNDDCQGIEAKLFHTFKSAQKYMDEIIFDECQSENSWIGTCVFDKDNNVKDGFIFECNTDDATEEQNLYWKVISVYDNFLYTDIRLKKIKVEQNFAIRSDELRSICIKNNWFTNGSISQYTKLFELNDSGASLDELALIIWLCSQNTTKQEIKNKLLETEND